MEGIGGGLILENIQEFVLCYLETLPDTSVSISGIGNPCKEEPYLHESRSCNHLLAGSR